MHLLFRLSDMVPWDSERFQKAWAASDDERRRLIMRHLADLAEESFIVDYSSIFRLGLADDYAEVRLAAVDGLWDSTDTRFVSLLLTMMQEDPSLDVRAAAASGLAHYVLMAEWGQIPARVSDQIVGVMLTEYEKPETAVPIKRAALEALGATNHPRVTQFIQEAYDSRFEDMRISAIFAMGNTADERWLSTILAELENPDAEMQAEAARAAGLLGRSDAVEPLALLLDDEDADVRVAAIVALGQIGGAQAQNILGALLEDPDQEDMHELIEETIEDMLLLSGELDIFDYLEGENSLPDDDDDDDEEL
ncbi:MAG: HEAT repeat domain-containing protein [Chloroflexota bacterium]